MDILNIDYYHAMSKTELLKEYEHHSSLSYLALQHMDERELLTLRVHISMINLALYEKGLNEKDRARGKKCSF